MSYALRDYAQMIADPVRSEAYVRALRAVVRPGAVVLDLGAGTGFFSLVAARLGARRVFACESGEAIDVARELVRKNGLAGIISCFEQSSESLRLPEPVDVIVSDLRGRLPLYSRHLAVLVDARARHLKPGGILVPQKDRLWVALADAAEEHRRAVRPWADDLGLDLAPWSTLLSNSWIGARVQSSQLVSAPAAWAELDYRTLEDFAVRRSTACVATRAATVHGFFLWFDATLVEGVSFSAGPDAPEMVYGSAFFPWPEPVALAAGDEVVIDLDATLVGDDYNWSWKTLVRPGDGRPEVRFTQSTFLGAPLSPETLRRRSAGHVPALNEDGRLALRVLEELGRHRPLGELAAALLEEFPGRFRNQAESLGFIGKLSTKYCV